MKSLINSLVKDFPFVYLCDGIEEHDNLVYLFYDKNEKLNLSTYILPGKYEEKKWDFIKLDYKRRMDLINHPEKALPNADSVTVDKRKFTEYLFGGNKPEGLAKGKALTSRLGYDINNYQSLKNEIKKNVRVIYGIMFRRTQKREGSSEKENI